MLHAHIYFCMYGYLEFNIKWDQVKCWKIKSYSCSCTVSCDLSDLEWMKATSFDTDSDKNKLVFPVRAVIGRLSDPLSNFSPAPRADLTFCGLHRGSLISAVGAPAPAHCADWGVGGASAGACRQRPGSGGRWGQTHGRTAWHRVMEAVTMVTKLVFFVFVFSIWGGGGYPWDVMWLGE